MSTLPSPTRLLAALLLLAGCSSGGGGVLGGGVDYTLHLVPVLGSNQNPFADLTELEMEIAPAVGEPTRIGLTVPSSGGTAVAEDLPEFEDAVISVYGYDAQGLAAWGHSRTVTLSDGDDLEIPMLFASVDAVAWLGPLQDPVYGGALLAIGGGRFDLLGGVTNDIRGQIGLEYDQILSLDLAEPSDPPTFVARGTLPQWTEADGATTHTGRTGFTAHLLTEGDYAGWYLLAGGAPNYGCDDASAVTGTAVLYDPVTGAAVLHDKEMEHGRSEYTSIADARGYVIYQGGAVYDERGGCYIYPGFERFDPTTNKFRDLSQDGSPPHVGAAAATLGTDGSLFCGGVLYGSQGWETINTCFVVNLEGAITTTDGLESPVAGAAAITLDDGTVLLTGGIAQTTPTSSTSGVAATRSAWAYRSGAWVTLGTQMSVPRAGHRMERLPDGRVAIVGGAASWAPFALGGSSYACVEVYDPSDDSFTPLSEGCDESDAAADLEDRALAPMVALDPAFGLLVAGGSDSATTAQGTVGIVVAPP